MDISDIKSRLIQLSLIYDWDACFSSDSLDRNIVKTLKVAGKTNIVQSDESTIGNSFSTESETNNNDLLTNQSENEFENNNNDESFSSTRFDVCEDFSNFQSDAMMTPKNKNKGKAESIKSTGKSAINFNRAKVEITKKLFTKYNNEGFNNLLPNDLKIIWNKRLTTTAGFTKLKKLPSGDKVAEIELSTKVIDNEERLQHTLLHELCHAAVWLLDNISKPPHGPAFWKWAKIASDRIEGASVTTCHSFSVHKPFKFECSDENCKQSYSRHSKKGINLDSQRCGRCRAPIVFLGAFLSDGTPRKQRQASGFSIFVQKYFANVKANNPGKSHGFLMQELARKYKEESVVMVNADAEQYQQVKDDDIEEEEEGEEDISSLVIDISSISLS